MERRKSTETTRNTGQQQGIAKLEEPARQVKPFHIDKWEVWEAWEQVKANGGSGGVDGKTIADFEQDLKGNLYKIWNRMSSGSYFPPPVKRVDIPKSPGVTRPLGIPTVADRVAQMVIKRKLEPHLDPLFHHDSYGYRPGKSAHQAIAQAKQRCWGRNWVLDIDIKGFFDNLSHELLLKALRPHVQENPILLYIERWLTAPVAMPDGSLEARNKGTPQGGVISPLLANLFLHYAFDKWITRVMPNAWFERYADDIVCHCNSLKEAQWLHRVLEARMEECGLMLHPQKTKIVYCKDAQRTQTYEHTKFDFLGYEFRARKVKRNGQYYPSFRPAISPAAAKGIRQTMREWRFRSRNTWSVERIAMHWNPIFRGWMNYYGKTYRSKLHEVLGHFDRCLASWYARKHGYCSWSAKAVQKAMRRMREQRGGLFAHWQWTTRFEGHVSVRAV